MSVSEPMRFSDLPLAEPVLRALTDVGYESPSPIQAATIPPLLEGRDVLGQAATGTGKTAAFALPALSRLDLDRNRPQVLVLAPTRELAIQVAEAFQRYAAHLPGFHVLPIYGGQSYEPQLKALKRGVHVVVGTPGRVADHLRRGTLKLDSISTFVLDEADEMLRMGFLEEVEWILEQAPPSRQIALFSATMPRDIRRIAQTYLRDPAEVTIAATHTPGTGIRQRYWLVSGASKLEALTRILEAETFDGMIVFARTKVATEELAGKLEARGFSAAALNGDLQQAQRERIVGRLRDGSLDIVVATDIAARGLDVERVSHVFNYDIPTDTESYVHRIGRTGRAGRNGEAILFVTPRERHLLKAIERATRQTIEPMELPSAEAVNDQRVAKFRQRVLEAIETRLAGGDASVLRSVVEQLVRERELPLIDVAVALAAMVQGGTPLLLEDADPAARSRGRESTAAPAPRVREPASAPRGREGPAARPQSRGRTPEAGLETYRVEVGSDHGVKTGQIVGAIANEAGLEGEFIGKVEIFADHSLVDLPEGMPKTIFKDLQKVWVSGRQLKITRLEPSPPRPRSSPKPGG